MIWLALAVLYLAPGAVWLRRMFRGCGFGPDEWPLIAWIWLLWPRYAWLWRR